MRYLGKSDCSDVTAVAKYSGILVSKANCQKNWKKKLIKSIFVLNI